MSYNFDITLIYPPHASLTQPYLSLPSLTAFLRSSGFRVRQHDASCEAFDLLLSPDNLRKCLNLAAQSLQTVNPKRLSLKRKSKLALAEACGNIVIDHIEEAKTIVRSHTDFYDRKRYAFAHNIIKRGMDIVSAAYDPLSMQFNELSFNLMMSWKNIYKLAENEALNPYATILRTAILPDILNSAPAYGISVTYQTQMVSAYTIAGFIKEFQPDAKIIMGGAYLTSILRGIVNCNAAFRFVDAYVFGEGETALAQLVELIAKGEDLPYEMTSVHLPGDGKKKDDFDLSLLNSEDFNALPTPDYTGLELHKYFAPRPVFLLSNGRGCYWRKCAFCSVSCATGKNFRQRKLEKITEDLDTLISRHQARHFFFSDDCIPPSRLLEIADYCRKKGGLYWQTEARYETALTPAFLTQLHQGGCLQLMFGNESGTQRVLDLMRKGTRLETNERIIRDTTDAGIAVHLQNFIGFPTETAQEATQTVDQLVRLRDHIASFALGTYHLKTDSTCYKEPHCFGLSNIRLRHKNDINGLHRFTVKQGLSQDDAAKLFRKLHKRLLRAFPDNDYFFDGPVGAHIMLYLEKHYQKCSPSYLLGKSTLQVNEMMMGRYRMNSANLTRLSGPEPAISLLFSHITGDCIPIMDDHLAFFTELDGDRPMLEAVIARTLNKGEFDDAAATVHMVVAHDMIRKEILVPCN